MKKPIIGISECLLGHKVRYNGGHTKDDWVVSTLMEQVTFEGVCPEVYMGLGTPRESIHLTYNENEISLRAPKSQTNLTEQAHFSNQKLVESISNNELSGFILMKKSPSCGLEKIKLYNESTGKADRLGVGLFAATLKERFPLMPMIDSGRLQNLSERELFLRQVYAYQKINTVDSLHQLSMFHKQYKYILMEHSPQNLKLLGQMVANANNLEFEEIISQYKALFMESLKIRLTPGKSLNVFEHVAGYFKNELTKNEKSELAKVFSGFRKNLLPYYSPLTLLKFLTEKYEKEYLQTQVYFEPFPLELRS